MEELITVAPQPWRAIQIHLGPMVAEFPGVVSFLSKLLAEDNISILNMSTYDTDIIYVQVCTSKCTIANATSNSNPPLRIVLLSTNCRS